MKKLLFFLCLFLGVYSLSAQSHRLEIKDGNNYVTNGFPICGNSVPNRDFRVSYNHCPNIVVSNCINTCLVSGNHIRFTIKLFRNGVEISRQTPQLSSSFCLVNFYNVFTQPGNYQAHIKVERRRKSCSGWVNVNSVNTNVISVTQSPNVSVFNINGVSASNAINHVFCTNNIRMNASATYCETDYFIAIEESDANWNKTGNYEWGRWFGGYAPDNIDLQALCINNSIAPYYTGTDASRQGEGLLGGNLPNGQPRYYRVKLCTAPNWQCEFALIRVDPSPNQSAFNINGKASNTTSNYVFCTNNIRMNAAATSCETDHYIAIEESDANWNRTGEYEWARWMGGQAPDNINLQDLCINNSIAPYYRGTDLSRQGQGLLDGNLANGQPRYYRVVLCTAPTWQCEFALIRVDNGCPEEENPFGDRLAVTTITNSQVDKDDKTTILGKVGTLNQSEGAQFIPTSTSINIAPQPLSSNSLVTIEGYTGNAPIQFEVYNSIGQQVMNQQFNSPQFNIQRKGLTAGIYVYRAVAGETVLGSGKLMIQ